MVTIEERHVFARPLQETFGYITDTRNWPEYWPSLRGFRGADGALTQVAPRWNRPGDALTLVLHILNRDVAVTLTIREFEPDRHVKYVTSQPGLAEAFHERYFSAVPGGTEFHARVSYPPRRGWKGFVDRVLVKRAVRRTLTRAIANVETVFARAPAK
ncbi:MAG TPA: SRPBCC family protein [Candidatus Binatia bacterium]|nr:SRPBCC family protein [Candidatus Binatia bacterium]